MRSNPIRVRRMKAGVTQFRLASIIGVPLSTLRAWEEGTQPIGADQFAIVDATLMVFEDRALLPSIYPPPFAPRWNPLSAE